MSTEHTITVKAADGALTMAELRAFVDDFEAAWSAAPGAQASGMPDLKPKARVSFGGRIKSITVTVPE